MIWAAIALMAGASVLPAATLVSFSREGNRVSLQLSDGAAQVDCLSDSSFRFSRRWGSAAAPDRSVASTSIELEVTRSLDSLTIATKYLLLTIAKRGALLRVAEPDGTPIMADASEAELRDGVVAWDRIAAPGARFHGLGARSDAAVELRGRRVTALKPFLISSAGYGEYHVAPGGYTFDLARSNAGRYSIEARGANRVDYYFFFGPTPKEILEQYLLAHDAATPIVLPKNAPAENIHRLINGSLSGMFAPAPLLETSFRLPGGLSAYFATYEQESRDKGLPLIRALPMQFPKDARAAGVDDEFMVGDELLAAPLDAAGHSRQAYLPMGIWTRLGANQTYLGKQIVTIAGKPGELVLFARNGSILPLGSQPMRLHYFPRLGGEFFLFESELEAYSQVHAAPAGDFMRLEIESKIDRDYEWIVHQVERPRSVAAEGRPFKELAGTQLQSGTWRYDSAGKSLHIRVLGRAGCDEILSVAF